MRLFAIAALSALSLWGQSGVINVMSQGNKSTGTYLTADVLLDSATVGSATQAYVTITVNSSDRNKTSTSFDFGIERLNPVSGAWEQMARQTWQGGVPSPKTGVIENPTMSIGIEPFMNQRVRGFLVIPPNQSVNVGAQVEIKN